MVRILIIVLGFAALDVVGQSVDLTIGARHNFNLINGNSDYQIAIPDQDQWPLLSSFNDYQMERNTELEFGLRFNLKNNWFFETGYSNSRLIINLAGTSNYSDSILTGLADNSFNDLYANMGGGYTYQEFYDLYYQRVYDQTRTDWATDLAYTEELKTHNIYFGAGYRFLQNKPIRPYVKGGITIKKKYDRFSYQYLEQNNAWVTNKIVFYNNIPSIWDFITFGNIGFGVDMYRLQAGVNLEFNLGAIERAIPVEELDTTGNIVTYYDFSKRLYNNWVRVGFQVSYDLVSADVTSRVNRKALENIDHITTGKYERKERKFVLGAKLAQPMINSMSRTFDSVLVYQDYIYDVVEFDTIYQRGAYQDLLFNRVKRVELSPEITAFAQFKVVDWLFLETGLAYQFGKVDIGTEEWNVPEYDLNDPGLAFNNVIQDLGAFRFSYDAVKLKQLFKFRVLNHDLVRILPFVGAGVETWTPREFDNSTPGVNSLEIHQDFYNHYFLGEPNETLQAGYLDLYSNHEDPNIDLTQTAWGGTKVIGTIILGSELELDRIKFGVNYEFTPGLIDKLMLSHYQSLTLSMAYNFMR